MRYFIPKDKNGNEITGSYYPCTNCNKNNGTGICNISNHCVSWNDYVRHIPDWVQKAGHVKWPFKNKTTGKITHIKLGDYFAGTIKNMEMIDKEEFTGIIEETKYA